MENVQEKLQACSKLHPFLHRSNKRNSTNLGCNKNIFPLQFSSLKILLKNITNLFLIVISSSRVDKAIPTVERNPDRCAHLSGLRLNEKSHRKLSASETHQFSQEKHVKTKKKELIFSLLF